MSDGIFPRERLETTIRLVLSASRQDVGLSRKEFAAKLQWPLDKIASMESGRKRVHLIDFLQIANVLDIDPIALLQRIMRW